MDDKTNDRKILTGIGSDETEPGTGSDTTAPGIGSGLRVMAAASVPGNVPAVTEPVIEEAIDPAEEVISSDSTLTGMSS